MLIFLIFVSRTELKILFLVSLTCNIKWTNRFRYLSHSIELEQIFPGLVIRSKFY